MKSLQILVFASLLGLQGPAWAQDPNDLGPQPPGRFDFYALSLTWVPGFCASHPDPSECSLGLGFALHGLWPESANGYPSFCSSDLLPTDVRASYQSLFASPSLIDHEWQKHGTCSGLGAVTFLETTRKTLAAVVIPPGLTKTENLDLVDPGTIKQAFMSSNPGLDAEALVLVCQERRVEELHVCLNQDGSSRACAGWERQEDNCR